MNKYNRNYDLVIGLPQSTDNVHVKPPFTMEFESRRVYNGGANQFSMRIYNLAPEIRNKIRQDVATNQTGLSRFRNVSLNAGYGDSLSQIIRGQVTQAWSHREGVNFITEIDGTDFANAYINGYTSKQYPKGTQVKSIITDMAQDLAQQQNVTVGYIGDYQGPPTARRVTYDGNTADLLQTLTGGGFCIDNGLIQCLQDNEVIDDRILIIDSSSGLLGTPLRESVNVHINLIFEPRLKINQRVLLQSVSDPTFDGLYKVFSIHHKVMISQVVCGTAYTEVGLQNLYDQGKVTGRAV